MKKNGFTLIELLSIIIILSVIYLIAFPVIDESMKNSKQKALEETITNLENAGYYYSLKHDLGYNEEYKYITLIELKESGVVENSDFFINPVTAEMLTGCIAYRWKNNQYEFKYVEEC